MNTDHATATTAAQSPTRCEICADAIISGRIRCTCGSNAEPHAGTCSIRRFESTHPSNAMNIAELLAALGLTKIEER